MMALWRVYREILAVEWVEVEARTPAAAVRAAERVESWEGPSAWETVDQPPTVCCARCLQDPCVCKGVRRAGK